MFFYKVGIVCVFLMDSRTLRDYVESDDSRDLYDLYDLVFVSEDPISADNRPMHYKFDKVKGNDLSVFPVDHIRGKPVVREKPVGLLYWQQKNNPIKKAYFWQQKSGLVKKI